MTDDTPTLCPLCNEPLSLECIYRSTRGQTITTTLYPSSGGMITAAGAGRYIRDFGLLMEEMAKSVGTKERAFISGLNFAEDGAIEVKVLLAARQP